MAFDPFTGQITSDLPAFLRPRPGEVPMPGAAAAPAQPGVIGGGLRAGWNEMQGMLGDAVGAAGRAAGSEGLAAWGEGVGAKNYAEAQQFGRPDLETAPWKEGGAPVLPWLGYQTAKQGPQLAAAILGSLLVPEAAVPAGLAKLGASVPAILGGGGLRAGASVAAKEAAAAAGTSFAKTMVAAEVTGIPLAIGSMYREAVDRGDPTREDALKAIGLSPAYAALDALQPTQLKGLMQGGSPGKAVKRVLFAGLAGSAIEMPGEAAQTAMEMTFRPDLSPAQKADQIVTAALTGGAVGGVVGGIGGIKRAVDPSTISTQELLDSTDLNKPQAPAQPPSVPLASPQGEVFGLGQRPTGPDLLGPTPQAPARPFAGADAQQLTVDLMAVEERIRAGGATQADEMNRRALRSELAARDAETTSPLAQADTASLQQGVEALQRKPMEKLTQEDAKLWRVLNTELQRRERPEAPTADGGLFGDSLPEQERGMPVVDPRAEQVAAVRAKAIELAGGRNKFIDSLDATNDIELADAVLGQSEAGNTSARVIRLGEKMGLLDTEGGLRDFPTEIAQAEQRAEAMWDRVRLSGQGEKQATEFTRKVSQLKELATKQQDMLAQVAELRGQREFANAPVGAQTSMLGAPAVPQAAPVQPEAAPVAEPVDPNQLALDFTQPAQPEALVAAAQAATPAGALGEQLLAALRGRTKATDTDNAEAQLLEQRYQQMEDALIAQEMAGNEQVMPEAPAPAPAPRPRPEITPTDYQKQPRLPTLGRMPLQPAPTVAPEPTPVAETPDPNQIGMDFARPFATQALAEAARQQPRGEVGSQLAPQLQALAERDTQAKASARRQAEFDAAENQRLDQRTKQAIASDIGPGGLVDELPADGDGLIDIKRVGQGGRKGGERTTIRNRYRETEAGPGTVKREQVEADIALATQGWKGGIKVNVIDNMGQLPDDVRASVRAEAMEDAYGFVSKTGDVYIVAANLPNRAMGVATMFHEALGHLGLQAQMRSRLDRTMLDMYRSSKLLQLETKAWRDANPKAYEGDANPLARAVEEVLARRSERGPIDAKTWDKIVAVVKEFARKMGITLDFSDAEITAVLAMAHSKAMKGQLTEKTIGGNRYMYVGKGATLDRVRSFRLTQARAMDGLGADPETTRKATGWFKGPDGAWRQEISDDKAQLTTAFFGLSYLTPNEGDHLDRITLEDAINHPALFAAYPKARDIRVVKRKALGEHEQYRGMFSQSTNTITVTDAAVDDLGTMLHEIQHWVQEQEGFALGGTASDVVEMMDDKDVAVVVDELVEQLESDKAELQNVLDAIDEMMANPQLDGLVDYIQNVPESELESIYPQMKKAMFGDVDTASTDQAAELITNALRRGVEGLADVRFEYKGAVETDQFNIDQVRAGDREMIKANLTKADQFALYQRLMGEVEARETAADRRMTPAQRAARKPFSSNYTYVGDPIVVTEQGLRARGLADMVAADSAPGKIDSKVGETMKAAEKALAAVQKIDVSAAKPAMRGAELYLSTLGHIVERYGKLFGSKGSNPLRKFYDAHQTRVALEQRWSDLSLKPYEMYERLVSKDKKLTDDLNFIMGLTQFAIDPRKTWDQQDWLHGQPNADVLRGHVSKANAIYSRLRQKGGADVYEGFVAVNEATHFAQQAMALHNLANADQVVAAQLPSSQNNPMLEFLRTSSLHESPAAARKFWKGKVDALSRDVIEFSKAQRGMPGMSDAEFQKMENRTQSLAYRVKKIAEQQAAMERAPYFHLGRFGDYFVAFNVRTTGDGVKQRVDQKAVSEVAKRLEAAGIRGLAITEGTERPNVFIRMDSEQQARSLRDLALQMQKEGLLSDKEVVMDRRNNVNVMQGADELIAQLIQNIEATVRESATDTPEQKAATDALRVQMLSQVRDFYLDQLPDMAIAKVMVHRDSVPGFTTDMVRSYAFRTQVGAHALANLTSSSMLGGAISDMKRVADETRAGANSNDVFAQRDVLTEVMTREANRAQDVGHTFIDRLRAYNHAYFLGMSPAYALTNLTQLPVLLWPELAKKHGFAKSFKAMVKVTPMALRVIRATIASGIAMGPRKAADATISEAVLRKAGVPEAEANFIMRIVNTGVIDIGSASREHGRLVEDRVTSREDLLLRYAGSFGFYTEMTTRLIAALSARDLAATDPQMRSLSSDQRLDYAIEVVNQSMLNYSNYNVARAAGNSGVAGRMTRVATSFLQYSFQLIEKLSREIYAGWADKSATKEEKAEARRFLGTHLVAMTTLAGSLGLPAASILARVVESLTDILDDDEEPFDAKAAWRNMLADTFGQDVGEVLARGLPRAVGFDISGRVGEADIIPFTRLLVDKREWKEALNDWAFRSLGSPFSMGRNILSGGSQIADGNLLNGMKEIVPVALKSPIEAYKLSSKGYTDPAGNVLPMSPGALDILVQAMGFNPAEKAEYSEANLAQDQRAGVLGRDATNIRRNLASAIEGGDQEKAREWLAKARKFDRDNPGYAVLPNIGRTIQQRAKARAMSTMDGLPLGTSMRDPGAADLTRYANF